MNPSKTKAVYNNWAIAGEVVLSDDMVDNAEEYVYVGQLIGLRALLNYNRISR